MRINGKWFFNEVLKNPSYLYEIDEQFVLFESNECEFKKMNYHTKGKRLEYVRDSSSSITYDAVNDSWTDEAYRTIDFGAAYQNVSDEFYTWLTANAVQLSKPISMTHPKGIRLLTKGKKCTEDIEVVPTFLESVSVSIKEQCGAEFTIFCTTCENGTLGRYLGFADNETVTISNVLKGSVLVVQCGLENNEWTIEGDYIRVDDQANINTLAIQVNGIVSIKNSK